MSSLAGFPLANPASRRSSRFRAFLTALSSIPGRRAISPEFTRAALSTCRRAKSKSIRISYQLWITFCVILVERSGYYLLKTAFLVTRDGKREELERDWQASQARQKS